MPEVKIKKLHPYEIGYKCDKCGEGYLEFLNNGVLASNPPQYEHKCNICGYFKILPKKYPRIEYL